MTSKIISGRLSTEVLEMFVETFPILKKRLITVLYTFRFVKRGLGIICILEVFLR